MNMKKKIVPKLFEIGCTHIISILGN